MPCTIKGVTMRQLGNRIEFDSLILACDVGGTNTGIAVVGRLGRRFDILQRYRYSSQALSSMHEAVERTLAVLAETTPHLKPRLICISGAGPVRDNYCELSNVGWNIDGAAIAAETGIETLVINDFTAISYGIPLLDVDDPAQITPLPDSDGTVPAREGRVQAVVGAGTGLGVGYLVEQDGRFLAFSSEGGHSGFAPYDELTREMVDWALSSVETGAAAGSELFVSGQGIANTYRFFRETGRISAASTISSAPGDDIDPAAYVSEAAASGDGTAITILKTFVRSYARFASDAALHFLPNGGLFLAGGIVTKNERWFLEDHLFIGAFRANYREHIARVLGQVPIYIVKDYAISLYGAAHAAYSLIERT